jgi:hypothetical protein
MISRTYARQKALSYKNLAILLGRLVIFLSSDKMQHIFDYVNIIYEKNEKYVIMFLWTKNHL